MRSKFEHCLKEKFGFSILPKDRKILRSSKVRDWLIYVHQKIEDKLFFNTEDNQVFSGLKGVE